jgi:hypothetical protein
MTALRVFRAVFGTAACFGVALTALTVCRAFADLQMQAEQGWRHRCMLLAGGATMFGMITLLLGLLWFVSHREYRLHNRLSLGDTNEV